MSTKNVMRWSTLLWRGLYDNDSFCSSLKQHLENGGKPFETKRWSSFEIGTSVTFLVYLVAFFTFKILATLNGINSPFITTVTAAALLPLAFYFVFLPGIAEVPTQHHGVPKVFGTRLPAIIIEEGKYWLFWIFLEIEAVNMKQQYTEVSSEDAEVLDEDGVDWDVVTDVSWHIVDAYARLNAEIDDVESMIISATRSAVLHVFREYETDKIRKESNDEICKKIRSHVNSTVLRFGAEVLEIYFSKTLPDPEYMKALRSIKIEGAQRSAEEIEIEHGINQIKKVSTETGLTPEDARDFFQTERGKVEKKIQENRISLDGAAQKAITGTMESIASLFKAK